MDRRYAWFAKAAMAFTLVLAASACTSVVNGALGLAGIDRIDRDAPPIPGNRRGLLAARSPSPSFVSGYEVMPNRLLWDPQTGRLALGGGPLVGSQWDACEPVREADGLLPARRLTLSRPVVTTGPVEVRVGGLPTIATGLGAYGAGRPDRMMRGGERRMSLMGTVACGFPTLDIRLTWFGSTGPLVAR
jgi:hypothetical protein